jgi:hypothetical protein
MPNITPDGRRAATTANATILLRILSNRGNGRYLARARGVAAFMAEAGLIGVTPSRDLGIT